MTISVGFKHMAIALMAMGFSSGALARTDILPAAHAPAYAVGEAKAPFGWIDFCKREPAECAVDRREPETIRMTTDTWRLLRSVNAQVNRSIAPITDEDQWGTIEHWGFPTTGQGDCEDYALLKRRMLVEAGLPRRAMRMTVVIDDVGDGHAVLTIRTDRGEFVLDNKRSAILPWGETGYVFVKREHTDRIGWTSLGHATSPSSTAAR